MTIEIEVNGNSSGEGFCIPPQGGRTFPFAIRLRSSDGSTVTATLAVAPGGPGVALSAENVTVDGAGSLIEAHALAPSQQRGDIVVNVLVNGVVESSAQLTALSNLQLLFRGRFQARLATNGDAYNHPRGDIGWTWALEGEPDFVPADSLADSPTKPVGRVIRFHNPEALRPRVPPIGVFVRAVSGALADGSRTEFAIGDPVIGQPVHLGPASYFAGNRPAPAGTQPAETSGDTLEPIANFEFHIGAWFSGTSGALNDRPKSVGLTFLSPAEINDFGIAAVPLNLDPAAPDYLTQLRPFLIQFDAARRADLLTDYLALSPADRTGTVTGRNLATRISHLGGDAAANIPRIGISTLSPGYWGKQSCFGKINAGLQVAGDQSPVMDYLSTFSSYDFFAQFFNFHADELCGQVDGFVEPEAAAGILPIMSSLTASISRDYDPEEAAPAP